MPGSDTCTSGSSSANTSAEIRFESPGGVSVGGSDGLGAGVGCEGLGAVSGIIEFGLCALFAGVEGVVASIGAGAALLAVEVLVLLPADWRVVAEASCCESFWF